MSNINALEIKNSFNLLRDENNIEDLYNKYSKVVYGIAFSIIKNREESEDIVQRVFTKIYQMDKSKLPSTKEASWLYTLTKNETIDTLRKNKVFLDIQDYEVEDTNDDIAKIIDIEYYNKIISSLDKNEREIVSLKILSNLSFDEIAKLLNIPSGTVKWKYYKAINSLKISLANLVISIIAFIIGLKPMLKKEPLPPLNINTNVENLVISQASNIDYLKLFSWSISAVFFILTIVFLIIFIKYQLKRRNKTSK